MWAWEPCVLGLLAGAVATDFNLATFLLNFDLFDPDDSLLPGGLDLTICRLLLQDPFIFSLSHDIEAEAAGDVPLDTGLAVSGAKLFHSSQEACLSEHFVMLRRYNLELLRQLEVFLRHGEYPLQDLSNRAIPLLQRGLQIRFDLLISLTN